MFLPRLLQSSPPVVVARGVLERLLGPVAADAFDLEEIPGEGALDVFEVESDGGRVRVRGSSVVALCRGAYDYLRSNGIALVTWEGRRVSLPTRFPRAGRRRAVAACKWRHYMNVVTFGYSTPWWDWSRWEREIDWMALHGFNQPLAMEGQEAIWRQVWLSFGVPEEELAKHFCGPAFLPWQRMGGVDGHAAPLPLSFIEGRSALQARLMERFVAMGMCPVVPGFAGFVPHAFADAQPSVRVGPTSGWCNFKPSLMVDFEDPAFVEIGRRFIERYRHDYGSAGIYLVDSFNEIMPQFPEGRKLESLAGVGESIYRAITAGDPDGTWMLQGWLFVVRAYWGPEEVKALLSRVPAGRAVVLDLACDIMEAWRKHGGFAPHQWIYCTLHNFGGSTSLCGDLPFYASRPARALAEATGEMAGMGVTPEGIEQNSAVYELLADTMWQREVIDLEKWLRQWIGARYGVDHGAAMAAWKHLVETVYSRRIAFFSRAMMPLYTRRPVLGVREAAQTGGRSELRSGDDMAPPLPGDVMPAARLLLETVGEVGGEDLLLRDLVDVLKRALADRADGQILRAEAAYRAGDQQALQEAADQLQALLADLDRLLHTRPEWRLETWRSAARAAGASAEEKRHYDYNAVLQVTVWGWVPGVDPNLADYAKKEWSGLVLRFYAERWVRFHQRLRESLSEGKSFSAEAWLEEIRQWELAWVDREARAEEMVEEGDGDTTAVAADLCSRWGELSLYYSDFATAPPATPPAASPIHTL